MNSKKHKGNNAMKKIITTAIALIMYGCSENASDISGINQQSYVTKYNVNISGVVSVVEGVAPNIKVCLSNGLCSKVNDSGKYRIVDSTLEKVAASRIQSDTIAKIAYIIAGKDTINSIHMTSWNSILPNNYVVQRNVGGYVKDSMHCIQSVEVVFWKNDDSIARVVSAGYDENDKGYSTFIYTAYSDSDYIQNSKRFTTFSRAKNRNGLVLGMSSVKTWGEHVGDLNLDIQLGNTLASYNGVNIVFGISMNDTVSSYIKNARIDTQNVVDVRLFGNIISTSSSEPNYYVQNGTHGDTSYYINTIMVKFSTKLDTSFFKHTCIEYRKKTGENYSITCKVQDLGEDAVSKDVKYFQLETFEPVVDAIGNMYFSRFDISND